jgi:DNA-binding transcriptional LysR family regulator
VAPGRQGRFEVQGGATGVARNRHVVGEWLRVAVRSRTAVNNAETCIVSALAGVGFIEVPLFDVREHQQASGQFEVMPQGRSAPVNGRCQVWRGPFEGTPLG